MADIDNVVQPEVDTTQTQTVDTTVTPTATENTQSVAQEFDIEGVGKVTAKDIKEWKLGHMRQSDYTRKTQEIAKQRDETKDALEVYNYLKANPGISQALASGDANALVNTPIANKLNPVNSQFNDVNYRLARMELDTNLNQLKSKYSDFNEVEVLTEADRLGVGDLEFVYNALRGKNMDSMKATMTKQIENELTEKIRRNGLETQTIISPTDTKAATNHGLTPEQLAIAVKMKLTPEQYAKGVTI